MALSSTPSASTPAPPAALPGIELLPGRPPTLRTPPVTDPAEWAGAHRDALQIGRAHV